MLTISRKYLFFHPLLWTLIGYMVWMAMPPFFTEEGHMWKLVLVDFIGFCFLCFGYFFGAAIKNSLIPNYRLAIRPENVTALIISLMLIIYGVRLYLFSEVGIYAFLHPYARESSLLDTFARNLTFPFIVLVMTMLVLTKQKIYGILLLLEFIFFIVPTLARSYYLTLILDFSFIQIFFFHFKFSKITKYLPVLALMLFMIGVVGPYMHAVRSLAYVGRIEEAGSVSFESSQDDKFLVDRLNVHAQSWNYEPVVLRAAELDKAALIGILSKWLGFSKEYALSPANVSSEIGLLIGSGATSVKTATDIPRNYILMHYPIGTIAVVLFNFIMGFIFAITYKIIYLKSSLIFLMLWAPFLYEPAFGGQGAMASTFIFQYLLTASAFVLLLMVFLVVKYLMRVRLHPCELFHVHSKEISTG